jgi:hypothetical protein
MQKGVSMMYSQFSPRRDWDDIGWKTSPAIIPHLEREGNLSQSWDAHNTTYVTVHFNGLWAQNLLFLTALNHCLGLGDNKKLSGGNKKIPLLRFPTVRIVRKVPSTINKTQQQTSLLWWAVCPTCGMGSMNRPNLTHGQPSEGVGWGWLCWVLFNSTK